jgi:hypothetical protein
MKRRKGTGIGKEEVKVSLCSQDGLLEKDNLKVSRKITTGTSK